MEALKQFYQTQYPLVVEQLTHALDSRYAYHGLRHTLDVIEQSVTIAQSLNCSEIELELLKIAALFHDLGFLSVRKGHEQASAELFMTAANGQLDAEDQRIITACILATTMPQTPKSLLEKIICDADLDYLGREDFPSISQDLFNEMVACGELTDLKKWDEIQVVFLNNHQFHTTFNQTRRDNQKKIHLIEIQSRLNG